MKLKARLLALSFWSWYCELTSSIHCHRGEGLLSSRRRRHYWCFADQGTCVNEPNCPYIGGENPLDNCKNSSLVNYDQRMQKRKRQTLRYAPKCHQKNIQSKNQALLSRTFCMIFHFGRPPKRQRLEGHHFASYLEETREGFDAFSWVTNIYLDLLTPYHLIPLFDAKIRLDTIW